MSDGNKYRQLGMFGIIVCEVVITPTGLALLAHWLTAKYWFHYPAIFVAAVAGLGIAFYRISLLNKKWSRDEPR